MAHILTSKQANVVRRAWENGEIAIDANVIEKMLFFADNTDFYWSKESINMAKNISEAVGYIIRKRFSRAQKYMDAFAYWIEQKEDFDAKQARYMAEADARKAKNLAAA